jgi:hypothetical protein
MAGLLLHRVPPIYPDSAKQSKIQGVVVVGVVGAIIDECGRVVEVNPISGPMELANPRDYHGSQTVGV